MAFEHKIGLTQEGMVTLSSLGVPPPLSSYSPGERVALASGNERDMGFPVVTWSWRKLEHSLRDTLRSTYCTGPSATVHIKTSLNDSDDAFAELECIMIWPGGAEVRQHTTHDRLDFVLRFLVLADETPT